MNGSALMKIGSWMGFDMPPTAVQGRILGSKGVWLLHPHDRNPEAEPRIWIRPSQMKIQLVPRDAFGPEALATLHRAHRIFDFVMPSRSTVPARLSRLTIVNLKHNGVPAQVLIDLMEEGLKAEVNALTQWKGVGAMPLLWNAVNKASGVSFQRLRRTAAGIQRALGLTRRRHDELPDDDDDDLGDLSDMLFTQSSQSESDVAMEGEEAGDVDMPPVSIAEEILERLQAGFSPLEDFHLFSSLQTLLEQVMKSYIKEYHIIVPHAAEAFIVPGKILAASIDRIHLLTSSLDPLGLLKPGEIHFKSSVDLKDGCLYLNPKNVTGDVLVSLCTIRCL
jgi:RNA-dependent RNA polymerase